MPGWRSFEAMTAKRFDHFMAFWQQIAPMKAQKPAKTSRRVAAAKESLKAVRATR
jgi:hypothetical protein